MTETQQYMGLVVQATDGEAGRVDDALVEQEGGRVHGLVVQGRGFFGNDVVLPASAITHVDGGRVFVNLSRQDVSRLPHYSPGQHGSSQGLLSQSALGFDRSIEEDEKR